MMAHDRKKNRTLASKLHVLFLLPVNARRAAASVPMLDLPH
jgi:hypothetical protein